MQGDSLLLECIYQTSNKDSVTLVSFMCRLDLDSCVCCWWLKWNLSSNSFLPFHYWNVQGGFGTYDEMCFVFTFYYPQIDLGSCLSLPQFQQTYPAFLATYLWVCTRILEHFLITAHFWKLYMTNTFVPLISACLCFLYLFTNHLLSLEQWCKWYCDTKFSGSLPEQTKWNLTSCLEYYWLDPRSS